MYLTQHVPECGSQSSLIVMIGNILILLYLLFRKYSRVDKGAKDELVGSPGENGGG